MAVYAGSTSYFKVTQAQQNLAVLVFPGKAVLNGLPKLEDTVCTAAKG